MTRGTKEAGGRGSREAIEKRRVARQLNAIFLGEGGQRLDGRTAKRRARLLRELKDGRNGAPLKAIEVVSHADELLSMGERLSAIRKNGVKAPRIELGDDAFAVVTRAQAAYGFKPEAWRLLGIDPDRVAPRAKRKGK